MPLPDGGYKPPRLSGSLRVAQEDYAKLRIFKGPADVIIQIIVGIKSKAKAVPDFLDIVKHRLFYFFPRLGDYYNKHGQIDKTLRLSNEALAKYPDRSLFLLAKSVALLQLDRYDELLR